MSVQSPKLLHTFILILFATLVGWLAVMSWTGQSARPNMPSSHIPQRPQTPIPATGHALYPDKHDATHSEIPADSSSESAEPGEGATE